MKYTQRQQPPRYRISTPQTTDAAPLPQQAAYPRTARKDFRLSPTDGKVRPGNAAYRSTLQVACFGWAIEQASKPLPQLLKGHIRVL